MLEITIFIRNINKYSKKKKRLMKRDKKDISLEI